MNEPLSPQRLQELRDKAVRGASVDYWVYRNTEILTLLDMYAEMAAIAQRRDDALADTLRQLETAETRIRTLQETYTTGAQPRHDQPTTHPKPAPTPHPDPTTLPAIEDT